MLVSTRCGAVLGAHTILKEDHFPGCQSPKLPPVIPGAPNFRSVGVSSGPTWGHGGHTRSAGRGRICVNGQLCEGPSSMLPGQKSCMRREADMPASCIACPEAGVLPPHASACPHGCCSLGLDACVVMWTAACVWLSTANSGGHQADAVPRGLLASHGRIPLFPGPHASFTSSLEGHGLADNA